MMTPGQRQLIAWNSVSGGHMQNGRCPHLLLAEFRVNVSSVELKEDGCSGE